jgi:hypothetical protein
MGNLVYGACARGLSFSFLIFSLDVGVRAYCGFGSVRGKDWLWLLVRGEPGFFFLT